MRRLLPLFLFAALLSPMNSNAADPHSYAQPEKVVVTHLDLDLALDFERRELRGEAVLSLDWKDADARELVLDSRELRVASVRALDADGASTPLPFHFAAPDEELGSKLVIAAPGQPAQVRIAYTTAPTASGLQWLTQEQTADKTLPFMFSQSEAIHARSWIPLQDSPAVRFTFSAHVTAPPAVRVVMGAINEAGHPLDGDFRFEQPRPIPSYLMAIAAGDLAVRETGPRSAVYAEPSVVDKAAHEFADTERMIDTAEALYGPYRWGRYDVLVLPPSFPYGGMENPNLTFVTPTVLVGDKSLVSLIAHELAHSWSGNLVTAASWRDIWLNEGFTTYVQGRITEALYGTAQADEEVLISARALQKSIDKMKENSQKLAPDPRDVAANDNLSDVAYDKGSWFLRTLEQACGREVFDPYVRAYFDHFAFRSIDTEEMLAWMKPNLLDAHPQCLSWDEVKAWIYQPGLPADAPLPDSPAFDAIDAQRTAFLAGDLAAADIDTHFSETDAAGVQTRRAWNTQEWMYFLDGLPERPQLAQMQALDAAFQLTGTPNGEIGRRWYTHAIAAGDKDVWPAAAEHMTRIGRLYLTMPLYRALVQTPAGLAFATEVYAKAKSGYHPMTQSAVEFTLAKAKKDLAEKDAAGTADDAGA